LHLGKNFKSSQADGLYVFAVHSIHDLDRAYKLLSHENRYRVVALLLGVIVIALPLITMQEQAIPTLAMVTIMKEDQQMVVAAVVVVGGCIIIGTIHPHHPILTMLQKLPIRNYVPGKCQHTWSVSPRG
jgi:hypothetical protein